MNQPSLIFAPAIIPHLDALRSSQGRKPLPFDITGIRFDDDALDDTFDDLLIFNNRTTACLSIGTTVPGKYWTLNPVTDEGITGAGRLVPGYYENSHVIGIHGAKWPNFAHEAWVQCGKLMYARDVNKDGIIEVDEPIQSGYGKGFNIHRCNKNSLAEYVDHFSAGCQVSWWARAHEAGIAMHKEAMSIKTPISYFLTTVKEWQDLLGIEDVRSFILNGCI